ncbi:MAG TPA: Mov34/MPN/PAD-1 family protein [Polyangiaceae bacterium]|jgi:[CysO sulfur-carrier protein]-S-L-cysteine hydrolase|nr:Mov34/MPN/PAD-1 family protein [Polyangiaceae bacterium]
MGEWIKGGLRITRAALDAVERDARRGFDADEEACGYVRGPATDALLCDEAVSMPNLANKLHSIDPETYFRTGRSFFAFNEKKFDDAVRRGDREGRPIKVLYHSHVEAGAYFSATDRAVMSMGEPPNEEGGACVLGPGPAWPLAFLVVSVRRSGVDDHKLFVWDGHDFAESTFEIVD